MQKPHFIATRAITIKAPASEVWKWIIQIGSARAGWYSIDWMDNSRVPSAREILPEFQKIEVGYFIPFTPNQKSGMWVKEYQEPAYILWWDKKGNGTWGWYLGQPGNGQTRLITRLRTKYDFSFPWVIYYLLYDQFKSWKCLMHRHFLGKKHIPQVSVRSGRATEWSNTNTGGLSKYPCRCGGRCGAF